MKTPPQFATPPGARPPVDAVIPALALIGFSAVLGQVVLMRELIVVFNGNEMSLGMMLATWLFWTATGSSLSGRLLVPRLNARRAVAALECLLAVSLFPAMWALRASKLLFQTVPGELVGPVPMLLATLACLSLFCAVSGALFAAAVRMCQQERGVSSRAAASLAYMWEAAGSGLGGVLASILLLRFLDLFQIGAIVAVLNLAMAAVLSFRMSRKRLWASALAAAFAAVLLLAFVAPWLNRSSQARLWQGFRLLASRDTIYGNLAVTQTGSIRSIYWNGVILANAPDESAAEEAVHYALLEHPAPRRILLIGGGANGAVAEALKHPTVERIDCVELDPALIDMARQFFPAQSVAPVSDPRVHLHYADGRFYLQTAAGPFDAIVLNLPDPQTAQLNRFYTAELFRSARDRLAPGGLLAFQLHSSEEVISPGLAEFLRCIRRTLTEVFPSVVILPGDPIHFFAATEPGVLTDDPQTLISRLRQRHLNTQYVREYFLPFRMMPDRMAQVRDELAPLPSTPVNRDFRPVAYYFDIVLWSAQFKMGASRWFQTAARIDFRALLAAILLVPLLGATLLALARPREKLASAAAASSMAATGFTLMTLQILLLLAFQSIYGYVYHQLAILIGLSMAGIALGSWLGMRRIHSSGRPPFLALSSTQFLLALSAPALMFSLGLLASLSGVTATWLAAQCAFPALAALSGMLGGYQFPLAAEVYLHPSDGNACPGTLYALDLLGGCVGALLLSAWLIPVFGFWRTAWLSAVLNLAPAVLAARASKGPKTSPARSPTACVRRRPPR